MTKRIETKVSKTAQGTCLMRAMSYHEMSGCHKSDDYIAPLLLPVLFKWIAHYGILRGLFKKRRFKRGLYEYIIVRTKLIDDIFRRYSRNMQQVLIFGAGFDSRAIRFQNELKQATVFELDAMATQNAKINKYAEKNIQMPPNLKFISVDFNKDSLSQKLVEADFQKNRTCLFILEGLTYYLDPEAIDNTFKLIREYAGENSLVVFDCAHASVIRQETFSREANLEGQYKKLKKIGEQPNFLVEGNMQDFLAKYDFELVDEFDSLKLAERFFDGEDLGVMTRMFSAVVAKNRAPEITELS